MSKAKHEGWRAFYTSGREFNSSDHDWQELPDDGVLVVILYYTRFYGEKKQKTRSILDGDTWYFHVPGTELYGCNNDPPEMNMQRFPGCKLKKGKWTTPDEFYSTKEKALEATCP